MTDRLIGFLPMIIPFTAGLLLLVNRRDSRYQKTIASIASILMVVAGTLLLQRILVQDMIVIHMGNWPPPITILFAIDIFSAIMVLLAALVGMTGLAFSFHDIGKERMKGCYYALYFFLLFGINGSFMTGDLFNLFVFFEIVLMASYVLLTLGNENKQTKHGFTYLAINLLGSTLFLVGAGLIYGQLGTLNMAHIAARIGEINNQGLVTLVAMIFFIVFGIKSAMFPLYNWLPEAYPSPPTPLSAIFAGLLTKVGVYSMFRMFGTVFAHDIAFSHTQILLPLAGLTMLLGVWGAVVQYNVKYILAFHSISQVGYILMGLALHSPLALAGGIYHVVHHSLIKSSLFLIGGGMEYYGGSQNLKKLGGLAKITTPLAVFFMISSLALAGIPPLSGFYSKLALIIAAVVDGHPILVAAALITSLFTLYSMIKIWRLGFWGNWQQEEGKRGLVTDGAKTAVLWSCGLSVLFVILLSVFANPVMRIAKKAGDQILDRNAYIRTVLTSQPLPHPQRKGS